MELIGRGVVKSMAMLSLSRRERMGCVGESARAESMSASRVEIGWGAWTSWIGVCAIGWQLHCLDVVVIVVVVVVCWVVWSLPARRRWPVVSSVSGLEEHA